VAGQQTKNHRPVNEILNNRAVNFAAALEDGRQIEWVVDLMLVLLRNEMGSSVQITIRMSCDCSFLWIFSLGMRVFPQHF